MFTPPPPPILFKSHSHPPPTPICPPFKLTFTQFIKNLTYVFLASLLLPCLKRFSFKNTLKPTFFTIAMLFKISTHFLFPFSFLLLFLSFFLFLFFLKFLIHMTNLVLALLLNMLLIRACTASDCVKSICKQNSQMVLFKRNDFAECYT